MIEFKKKVMPFFGDISAWILRWEWLGKIFYSLILEVPDQARRIE